MLTDRERRLKETLDAIRQRCDVRHRLQLDPVSVLHRYSCPIAQELVGVLASAVAFGNAKAFRAKLELALAELGPDILATADDGQTALRRLRGWRHRIYGHEDLVRLLWGARRVQRASGSLGQRFAQDLARAGELRLALVAFTTAIREAGGWSSRPGRAGAHILADPAKSSACKRLLLYLRWMIRPADGVDLGLWPIPSRVLLMPVDTHVHKLASNLGITRHRTASWQTAEEITAVLRRFDPDDPVKYDFALCHLGMAQHCPSQADEVRCEGCGVRPVCRHWAGRRAGDAPRSGRSLGVRAARARSLEP